MKTRLLFILILLVSFSSLGQNDIPKERMDSVKNQLHSDKAAYEQYIVLGVCHCKDQLDATNSFGEVFDELYGMWTPFSRLVGTKAQLNDHYSLVYQQSFQDIEEQFREMDEVLREHSNSELICSKMYHFNEDRKKSYQDFIHADNSLNGLQHYFLEYLNPSSAVINNKQW